jgi:hypothetical protein
VKSGRGTRKCLTESRSTRPQTHPSFMERPLPYSRRRRRFCSGRQSSGAVPTNRPTRSPCRIGSGRQ